MKLLTLIFCIFYLPVLAQFEKPFSLLVSANFNITTGGLYLNDAGGGLNLDGVFFADHKWQLLVESSVDAFIGDKIFKIDPLGRENKNPLIYMVKAGPQLFITKHFAISASAGPAWHSVSEPGFNSNIGFKFMASAFPGKARKWATSLFLTTIPKQGENISFVGFQLGRRFFR